MCLFICEYLYEGLISALAISPLSHTYLYMHTHTHTDKHTQANQDCFLVCRNFMRDPDRAVFAVFDGHGREGDFCAQFCRDMLVEKLG